MTPIIGSAAGIFLLVLLYAAVQRYKRTRCQRCHCRRYANFCTRCGKEFE